MEECTRAGRLGKDSTRSLTMVDGSGADKVSSPTPECGTLFARLLVCWCCGGVHLRAPVLPTSTASFATPGHALSWLCRSGIRVSPRGEGEPRERNVSTSGVGNDQFRPGPLPAHRRHDRRYDGCDRPASSPH